MRGRIHISALFDPPSEEGDTGKAAKQQAPLQQQYKAGDSIKALVLGSLASNLGRRHKVRRGCMAGLPTGSWPRCSKSPWLCVVQCKIKDGGVGAGSGPHGVYGVVLVLGGARPGWWDMGWAQAAIPAGMGVHMRCTLCWRAASRPLPSAYCHEWPVATPSAHCPVLPVASRSAQRHKLPVSSPSASCHVLGAQVMELCARPSVLAAVEAAGPGAKGPVLPDGFLPKLERLAVGQQVHG